MESYHAILGLLTPLVSLGFPKPVVMRIDEKFYIGVLFTAPEDTVHTRRVTNVTFLVTNVTSSETALKVHLIREITTCALGYRPL